MAKQFDSKKLSINLQLIRMAVRIFLISRARNAHLDIFRKRDAKQLTFFIELPFSNLKNALSIYAIVPVEFLIVPSRPSRKLISNTRLTERLWIYRAENVTEN